MAHVMSFKLLMSHSRCCKNLELTNQSAGCRGSTKELLVPLTHHAIFAGTFASSATSSALCLQQHEGGLGSAAGGGTRRCKHSAGRPERVHPRRRRSQCAPYTEAMAYQDAALSHLAPVTWHRCSKKKMRVLHGIVCVLQHRRISMSLLTDGNMHWWSSTHHGADTASA